MFNKLANMLKTTSPIIHLLTTLAVITIKVFFIVSLAFLLVHDSANKKILKQILSVLKEHKKLYESDTGPNEPGNSCEDSWKYFSRTNKCYKSFDQQTTITWMDAQLICRQNGGDLVIIHNEETNDFVNDIADGARIWIGAHRLGPTIHENEQFTWMDGTPLAYSKWATNSFSQNPDNWGGVEFCVFSYGDYYRKEWNDYHCWSNSTYQIENFVCQKDGFQGSQASTKDCPDGWVYFYKTNRCYKTFAQTGISWNDAQHNCSLKGGDLATIYDEATNTFVNELLESSNAWIGAFRVGPSVDPKPRNDQWIWNDGSPLDYGNWVNDQPNGGMVDEYCGMINRWKTEGRWNDASCTWQGITHYVCQL